MKERTRLSNRQPARFWKASTNKTSWGSATAFVLDAANTEPWMRCTWVSFPATLARLKERLSRNRHADLATVGQWLQSVYRGGCQYYAVPGNFARLQPIRDAIQGRWLRMLRRRSQRGHCMTWSKFSQLSKRWLPTPTILHPYPDVRFACQHPR
jgi:hypothetical protein